ncbi:MAG: hypothetical protein ACREQZ_01365 [Woeseiaceae bacterium]
MRRRVAAGSLFAACLLAALPALAHLTGVFAHFVEDINDPTASTRMLEQQLASVGERIEALEPELRVARIAYDREAEAAVGRIRFYDIYAGSALGALWAGAQNPIDVIASGELLQRRLEDDLDALAELSDTYDRLQQKDSALRRYAELLVPFRDASRARQDRLADPPPGLVSPFAEPYLAYRIAEDWEQLRGSTFVLYFHWASRHILELGMRALLVESEETGGGWLLGEDVLNALVGGDGFPFIENARFYLRADHINFSAELISPLDRYDLLTVGQLERTGPAGFQYRIEAIFIDGMPIDPNDPDVQREVYQGRLLAMDLDAVMPEGAKTATFEQRNGAVEFRFR